MRTFVYGAEFEPGDRGGIVVSFPDVPELSHREMMKLTHVQWQRRHSALPC